MCAYTKETAMSKNREFDQIINISPHLCSLVRGNPNGEKVSRAVNDIFLKAGTWWGTVQHNHIKLNVCRPAEEISWTATSISVQQTFKPRKKRRRKR